MAEAVDSVVKMPTPVEPPPLSYLAVSAKAQFKHNSFSVVDNGNIPSPLLHSACDSSGNDSSVSLSPLHWIIREYNHDFQYGSSQQHTI